MSIWSCCGCSGNTTYTRTFQVDRRFYKSVSTKMCRWLIIFIWVATCLKIVELKKPQLADESPDEAEPPRVFLFVFSGLAVGGVLRALIKLLNFPIPFRVLMLFVGCIVGLVSAAYSDLDKYTQIVNVKPRFLLTAFLPLLVFKTAFCLDAHTFMRSWGQIFFLAVPGLLISACFTGMLMMVILGHDDWTYAMGILFGTICSPIYPVEIVGMLKEIGQDKHLGILLEGEGLVGDSTVMILVEILVGVIDEHITTWYHVLMVFTRFAIGGIVLGLICGKIMIWIMGAMYNDVVNMLISTIVAAYITFYVGGEILSVSGVIAVMVLGIMASMEKTSLSVDVEVFLFYFWDMLAYITNTMVFLLVGVIIAQKFSHYTTVQDYTLVLVTYVVAGVARLIAYISMAPIVSRIGYGLTFRNMTIAVWSGLRGPVPFCLTLSVFHHPGLSLLGKELLVHIAGLVTLTLLVNSTSMPLLLRLLGLSELSMARKVNMNNCMRHLQNRRERTISILKMDRFLADANWPLVNAATVLKHPYKINLSDSDDEEENYLGYRITTCPDCLKEIPNEPTTKEMVEMTREARMRILKAKKISYSRQYENGMLSKEGIRVLTQAVETAMDTEAAVIELEGLHKCFKRQGFVHYTRRRLLAVFFKKSENKVKPPRKYWRRICYHIIMHPAFDMFIYLCIALNVIPIGLEIGLMPTSGTALSTGIKIANTIFFLIYFMEFVLKIYGFSWIYICQHGFRTYFGSYWNIFDFIILCVAFIDLVMDYVDMFSVEFNKVNHKASKVTLVTKLLRVIRLIRLLRLCKAWYPKLIKYCDSKIDKHLAFAYDVGKGFVTGEEEVSDMLIQMIDNKTIREDCRLRMEADRLAVTKELGMVQKDRPWIAITVKTRQAIRATLNSMGEAILELKVSGWVDDVEYAMLMESLEERLKYVRTKVTSVQPSPPKVMFKEVPWMADDEQISDFLYENVVTKVFDQGDAVCVDGEMADGIYIIVTGLFKLSYTPKKEILDSLAVYGALPVIDYIASARFDEKVEDYIVSGNCVGELSALTGRPYNCTITADTSSQAYILTHDVLKQAIQRNPDPINGLESKMWKSLSIRLATSILMDTPAYQSSTQEKIRFQLERAFVPNLAHYKVFGVNDMMEDIMLIEGVVFDYNTRDCYTAPCYIPRTVQKIVLPKSSHMDFETTVETKLLIIPARDVDEFDIMEREEEISEMVSTASVKCLQHLVQNRTSRLRRKRKRQTTFSMGSSRRVKYGDSRTSPSQSMYSRSHMTNTSSYETELQNINMYDHTSIAPLLSNTLDSYVINEKENKPPTQDRKISRSSAYERRVSSRRASSIAPKRPFKDSTNKDDGKNMEHRFSKAKEQQGAVSNEEEQNKPGKVPATEEEKRKSYDQNSLNKQKDLKNDLTNSQRQQSDNSRNYVQVPDNENVTDKSSPNTLQQSEEPRDVEKRKDSNEKQQSERSNSLAGKKPLQRLSADAKSLNERRQTMTLDDLLQNQRQLSNLRKSVDSGTRKERISDEIERIEVEQRSQLFSDLKDDMAFRRKSPDRSSVDKKQKLFNDDDKNGRSQLGSRKTVNGGSEEVTKEEQRKSSNKGSLSRAENAENDVMKQRRKSPDSTSIDRRQNVFRDADKNEQTRSDNKKTSNGYSHKSEKVNGEQRKSANGGSISRSENAENDMKQRRKSDGNEAREEQTSYRRKSVGVYPKPEINNYNDVQSQSKTSGDKTEDKRRLRRESGSADIRERKKSAEDEEEMQLGGVGSKDRKAGKSLIPSSVDKTNEQEFNHQLRKSGEISLKDDQQLKDSEIKKDGDEEN